MTPDLILTHRLEDRHQDHRVVAELTWNTFRSHTILEYEIPKYEGDLGLPNLYVPLPRAAVDEKVEMLMKCFPSQRERAWFTEDLFRATCACAESSAIRPRVSPKRSTRASS